MSQKIKDLETQAKSIKIGSNNQSTAPTTLNVNDLNNYSASISRRTYSKDEQSFELVRLNAYFKSLENSSKRAADNIKMELSTASRMPTNNIDEITAKLNRLGQIKNSISSNGKPLLDSNQIQRVDTQISNLTAKLDKLRAKTNVGSLSSVLEMPSGNLNEINAKMSAITKLRGTYSATSPEIVQLNQEYAKLSESQRQAMTAGLQLHESNNKLISSFGNLAKRVVFYTGLGAITGFVEQIYQIRGEYEMLERSMGAIIGSFKEGSRLFNEIQQQALQSPMTVIDLTTSAKQLVAYNFGLNEIADTTKRLADISSALGVPMERMTYNLGQIKAQGFLTARDARDFANAGLAIVPKLAEMYSNLNGKVVTTSDVYDMLTKKMVPYSDVMKVINGLTDDGGMFFDFQAKQAETLKGQLSNLVDAWNLMLNQIGEGNQGMLKGSVSLARDLFTNWKQVYNILLNVGIAFGAYKAMQLLADATIGKSNVMLGMKISSEKRVRLAQLDRISALRELTAEEQAEMSSLSRSNSFLGMNIRQTQQASATDYQAAFAKNGLTRSQALWMVGLGSANNSMKAAIANMGLMTTAEIASLSGWNKFSTVLKLVGYSLREVGMSMLAMAPQMLAMVAISALVQWGTEAKQRAEDMAALNKSIADQAKQTVDDINQYLKDNQPTIQLTEKGVMGNAESLKFWDNLREEIEKTSSDSEYFISKLMLIDNIQGRNENAIKYLKLIRDTSDAMKGISDIDVMTTDSGPMGLFGEGMVSDLQDYGKSLKAVKDEYDSLTATMKNPPSFIEFQNNWTNLNTVKNFKADKAEAEAEIDASAAMMERAINSRGIYLDKNKAQFMEALSEMKDAILKANPQIQGAMLDLFNFRIDKKFGSNEAAWDKFMQVLKGTSASAFSDMTSDALSKWDGYNAKSNSKMDKGIRQALDKIKNSSPDFYNEVYRIIQNAPDFRIRIGLAFGVNPMGDFQKDFEKRASAYAGMNQSLYTKLSSLKPNDNQDIVKWKKDLQSTISSNNAQIDDWGKKTSVIGNQQISTLKSQNKLMATALRLYGFGTESDKDLAKYQKKREQERKKELSEVAQSIKNEIDIIDKLSGNYDKLTKSGMRSTDAIKFASEEFTRSFANINKVLGKYGLPKFNASQFTGKEASGQLDYLTRLQTAMRGKGLDKLKPDAYKEVGVQIDKIRVEAKSYDLTKINDDLKEQLSNIKDSYQLGLDIKDNPDQWNLLSNMIHITPDKIEETVTTAKEAALKIQDEIDKAIRNYNKSNNTNVSDFSIYFGKSDINEWMKQNKMTDKNPFVENLKTANKDAQDLLVKEYQTNVKSWDALLAKYAEFEYKRNEIQKNAATERLNLIQSYGTSDEYKQALDLANQIRVSDDSETVNRLQKQLASLTEKVTSKNDKAKAISVSISQKIKSDQGALDWDKFTKSDLYQKAFEEMDRVSVSSLKDIMSEMDRLKNTSDITFSPEQMKAYSKAYKQVRDALETRAPFETIVSSMKAWIQATRDKKKADEDLILAENSLTTAKKRLEILKSGTSNDNNTDANITKANNEAIVKSENDVIRAEQNLKKARDNKANATDKAANAETSFRKSLTSSQQALSQSASLLSQFMDLFDIDKESKFGQGLSALVKGLTMVATALGIIITVAVLAELSLGWVAIIGAALSAIIGSLTWIGGKKDTYSGLKKSVDNLSDAIDKASSKMTQLLETATGEKAMSYYKQLIKNNDDIIQSYRDLAKAAGESGSSMGSHSYAYRTNKALKNDWGSISNVVGVSVSKVQDLYNLSAAQLELLRTQMPVAWSNISSDIRTALEGIITYGDKADDYVNDLAASLVDVKFDDLTSSFKDMLSNLDTSTKDWADNFEKYMRNAIVKTLVYGDDFQAKIKQWYKDFQNAMSDEILTASEKTMLNQEYNNIVKGAQDQVKTMEEAAGLNTSTTSDLSSLQQGIQNMTEDTGGALEASLNGISGQVYLHTTLLQGLLNNSNISLGVQSQMLLQMRDSYQIQKSIQSMISNAVSNNGKSFRVELIK